jgi:acetamidase/formamidase
VAHVLREDRPEPGCQFAWLTILWASMEHAVDPMLVHHLWDKALAPILRIASGDTVDYVLRMAAHGQVSEGDDYARTAFDFATLYHLSGPVWVEGARPGDTLRVDILALEPGEWGWAAVLPEQGLLPDDFTEPWVGTFDLRERGSVEAAPGIRIPTAPFLGTMGTHPDVPKSATVFPPHRGGGNIDTRHLTVGSTLWLPVWCDGALFSCGDPHAAQGDGEVCVTAIECDMRASLRLSVEPRTIAAPCFRTAPTPLTPDEGAGQFGTMGISPDLMAGARAAVRAAIDWLESEQGLSRREAYVLCSLAGDLKIFEIVDAGVWNVGFTLPLAIFPRR